MKKIACVGYHYTGSGVIDDLLRECDNVAQGVSEAESSFLQATDGVLDLEYHLVKNPHRTGSTIAIERFLRFARQRKKMYEKVFGDKWFQICYDYIESLSKFQFEGYSYDSLFIRKPYLQYVYYFYIIINKFVPLRYRRPRYYDFFPDTKSFHAWPTEKEFVEKTRKFIDNLCEQIPHNDKTEFVLLDQLIAGNNPSLYTKFVNDLKVIVVDRDPRDMYIYHHSRHDHMLPKDPHQFCVHYRDIREKRGNIDSDTILYVTFEDMIYSYDDMKQKVFDFIGIDSSHHIKPREFFNPDISIKGTQLWKTHKEYDEQLKVIEQELPDFLHQY